MRLELAENPVTVYNFQVKEFHTYYVGVLSVLVHNANCKLIVNDDGTYDVELSYKEDWTPEPRREADNKCKALTEAKTVKTKPNRKGSASARYKAVKGKDSVKVSQDVDHTIDLQLGGVDDITNMNLLDSSVNRSLGKQIAYLLKDLDYGTIIKNFKMGSK